MNATRNLEIKFFINNKLDHVIKKHSKGNSLKANEAHRNNPKHKKYKYKKRGTGGYDR